MTLVGYTRLIVLIITGWIDLYTVGFNEQGDMLRDVEEPL